MAWGMYEWQAAKDSRRRTNAQNRAARMAAAKAKGTHTKAEWEAMKEIFVSCVICCEYRVTLCKDHITPIYMGGCDCLANIQPLCTSCNSRKGPDSTDYRSWLLPDWCRELEYELRGRERA